MAKDTMARDTMRLMQKGAFSTKLQKALKNNS